MDEIEELGLAENTIIVLWGDHGYHLGDHGLWGKSTNFEQATRSPMIISAPGVNPSVVEQPTEFVDIYPTLCDLARIPKPSDISGQSLVQLMETGKDDQNRYAISQFTRDEKMGYAIRNGRYRYVEWMKTGRHTDPAAGYEEVDAMQLFDYEYDPDERVNIAYEDSMSEVRAELAAELHGFLDRVGN